MTEPVDTETIAPDELAAVPEPIVFDAERERENAAAASAASAAATMPRRPGAPPRDPDAPLAPRAALVAALRDQFDRDLESSVGKYTPVAINLGSLADVALAMLTSLPPVPNYDPADSPRERFYGHRVPELDPEEFYIPGGGQAGAVTSGATPVPQAAAVERRWSDGVEVVAIPVRPAGAAEQDPTLTLELPLRAAQAFGMAVLSATWADPVPIDEPSKD